MTRDPMWPSECFTDLDRRSANPLHLQLADRLQHAITSGRLRPGDRLENEISIAQQLGLSRPTVRRAIQHMVDRGLLVRRRGVGTQVVQSHVARELRLTSLKHDLERSGHTVETRVLGVDRVPVPADVAALLGVPEGRRAWHVRRVRSADGVPVAVMENTVPDHLGPLDPAALAREGLYSLLEANGVSFQVANQTIGARRATRLESDLLEVPKGSPVLTVDRVAFDQSGDPAEVGRHAFRADRYRFETTLINA